MFLCVCFVLFIFASVNVYESSPACSSPDQAQSSQRKNSVQQNIAGTDGPSAAYVHLQKSAQLVNSSQQKCNAITLQKQVESHCSNCNHSLTNSSESDQETAAHLGIFDRPQRSIQIFDDQGNNHDHSHGLVRSTVSLGS
ncbi:hypothetical protein ACOSP7_030091 [Xanthoceras sorbifolium]